LIVIFVLLVALVKARLDRRAKSVFTDSYARSVVELRDGRVFSSGRRVNRISRAADQMKGLEWLRGGSS
jgi:hypothetical protein